MITLQPHLRLTPQVVETLKAVAQDLGNLRSSGPFNRDGLAQWAFEAEQRIRGLVSPEDLRRLVATPRVEAALASPGSGSNKPAELEIEALVAKWHVELSELAEFERRWSDGVLVAFDTNVFLHHVDDLASVDVATMLNRLPMLKYRILIPMVVLQELDQAKGASHLKGEVRQRARAVVNIVAKHYEEASDPAASILLRERQPGGTYIDVLPDPPGHSRLPINDQEIATRVAAHQALLGREITLFSGDSTMMVHGRLAGLDVRYLESGV